MSEGRLHPRERIDRHRARAWALQVHYRWETAGGGGATLQDALVETQQTRRISPRRLPRVRRLVRTLDEHRVEVDRLLQTQLDNWQLDRLAGLDRGILRLAATELLYFDDVPPRVVLQEAIHLAEAYGGAESPRFVNGVLDGLYRRAVVDA